MIAKGKLNEKIISTVKDVCGEDDVTWQFLSEVLFYEALKKGTRYSSEYIELIKKYAKDWVVKDEI